MDRPVKKPKLPESGSDGEWGSKGRTGASFVYFQGIRTDERPGPKDSHGDGAEDGAQKYEAMKRRLYFADYAIKPSRPGDRRTLTYPLSVVLKKNCASALPERSQS